MIHLHGNRSTSQCLCPTDQPTAWTPYVSQWWSEQKWPVIALEEERSWRLPSLDGHSWCQQRLHSSHCRHRRWQKSCGPESRCRECDRLLAENRQGVGWCPDHRKSHQWVPAVKKSGKTEKWAKKSEHSMTMREKKNIDWNILYEGEQWRYLRVATDLENKKLEEWKGWDREDYKRRQLSK